MYLPWLVCHTFVSRHVQVWGCPHIMSAIFLIFVSNCLYLLTPSIPLHIYLVYLIGLAFTSSLMFVTGKHTEKRQDLSQPFTDWISFWHCNTSFDGLKIIKWCWCWSRSRCWWSWLPWWWPWWRWVWLEEVTPPHWLDLFIALEQFFLWCCKCHYREVFVVQVAMVVVVVVMVVMGSGHTDWICSQY